MTPVTHRGRRRLERERPVERLRGLLDDDLRATGQVVKFDGFLKLYQEGRDDEEDEEGSRLPPMSQGDRLAKEKVEASQHHTEPPPRFTEATISPARTSCFSSSSIP